MPEKGKENGKLEKKKKTESLKGKRKRKA